MVKNSSKIVVCILIVNAVLLSTVFAQKCSFKDTLISYRFKTNITQLLLKDINLSFEINKGVSNYGINAGYNVFAENTKGGIPERNYNFPDVTIGTNFYGPHISINYMLYTSNQLRNEKSYLNFDLYYKHNIYDSICIVYGSNGTSSTKRQLIQETGNLYGFRMMRGLETRFTKNIFAEVYFGFGLVFKQITRYTKSEGSSGGYRDILVDEYSKRFKLSPTLQLGIILGFEFDKKKK